MEFYNVEQIAKDGNLVIHEVSIPYPEFRTTSITIPGRDGELDVSAFLGEQTRKNRTVQVAFLYGLETEEWKEFLKRMQTEVDGEVIGLTFDNEYYFKGLATVREINDTEAIRGMEITVNAEPYKLKMEQTVVTFTGSKDIALLNDTMPTVPTIKTTSSYTIMFDGVSYAIPTGTSIVPDIKFKKGNNNLKVTGNGTITFTYQEGSI